MKEKEKRREENPLLISLLPSKKTKNTKKKKKERTKQVLYERERSWQIPIGCLTLKYGHAMYTRRTRHGLTSLSLSFPFPDLELKKTNIEDGGRIAKILGQQEVRLG